MELDLLFSFGAVICYAYLFNVPIKSTLIAGFAGSIAWMISNFWIAQPVFAIAIAAFTIGIIAYLAAPRIQEPVTTVIIPAIIVLVPGIASYNALRYAIEGDSAASIQGVITVISATLSIAGGLSVSELIMLRINRIINNYIKRKERQKMNRL
ncbi:MAG: threonine/serine exporter [Firmicutes bacterium]|jgi:uncharacterized membrane protein YjjB (DUF3815 family)|nr:threonine/serine exporter [Bacillota bacterium]